MSQDTPTESTSIEIVTRQVRQNTPIGIIEQIAIQVDRSNEAKKRIDEEGIVVRDMKGSVIPHPAIKIEQDACKIITGLFAKHMAR